MTSIPLHSMPRWRTVAAEQIHAVGLMTRRVGLALISLLVVLLVVVVQASMRSRNLQELRVRSALLDITVAPWAPLGAIIAVLFAIAIWRDEDPTRRSYHWMMPVEPHVHTLTKVLAGWVWLLIASALCLASIASIDALSAMIAGYAKVHERSLGWWYWLYPLTAVTVAYFLASAAAVGTRQPILWVVGVSLIYSGTLLGLEVLGYRDTHHVVRTALTGEYGFTAAMAGSIDRLDTAQLRMVPSVGRWLGSFALWGTLSAILLAATAYRRAEIAVVGAHGPFRRAISGHVWLVASVIAFSVAAGVVATRVMKPEYEARATIWSNPRVPGQIAVSVREDQMTRAITQIDLLRSARIIDTVARQLALYVRPDNAADTSLVKNLTLKDSFVPGDYRLAVNDLGTRWQLRVVDNTLVDSGVAGDSAGATMFGLRWRPEAASLARVAGREIGFTVVPPGLAARELQSRLKIVQPPNSSFMLLSITDPDPHRAARTLNAIAYAYVAKTREPTVAPKSVLDSAVAPLSPFKNSSAQLFSVSVVIGVAAAIGLAFAASALERRLT